MASLNGLQTRQILIKGVVKTYVINDTSVAIRLKALAAAGAVTSVTVTTATNIVIIDSVGTKTYAFATYDTVGKLVDAINADGRFEARALDTLRSLATASQFVTGANTITAAGYYDILVDTSAAIYAAYCLSFDRNTGVNPRLRETHRVHLQEIYTNLTLGGGADANALKVYERTPGGIETLLFQQTPTTGSAATINWASGRGYITAGEGNEIVVIVSDGTSFATTDVLTVSGLVE